VNQPGRIGKYRIDALIGSGGMGKVFRGFDEAIERAVAIKAISLAGIPGNELAGTLDRFRREAQAAGRLIHPNIVQVYEYGKTGDLAFIAMELVEGRSLHDDLAARRRYTLREVRSLMAQMLDALEHSHRQGVVHRDVKPANILLGEGNRVKLGDFGIARLESSNLTQSGQMFGTPYYMSPEQAMGKLDVDQRTDVFAAAAIAWELATGKVAFEGANVAQILMKIVNEDPAPPSQLTRGLSASFDDAVLRGVKKDKLKRPASAGELAKEIVKSLGLPGTAATYTKMPESEIAAALAQATPPAAQPFGAAVTPNVTAPASAANGGERSRKTVPTMEAAERPPTVPTQGSKAGIAIAAVAALVLLGGLIAFFMFR